ncbi:MAG: hypothetical protein GQE15_18155 [Archangiaceae bacterium]|nr:hypothetical protein [Archangiaceae bacterium]
MKRATTLVLVMLAMVASGAVDARVLAAPIVVDEQTQTDGSVPQLVEVQQHAGSTTRITTTQYNGNQANLVDVIDGLWHQVITRDWDGQGRPTLARETWNAGSSQYSYETVTTWATSGRTANVNHTWSPGVAPTGEHWEYDGLGNALLHRVGVVEDRWVRDGLGRLKEVDTAEEPVRTFEYGTDGRLKLEKFGAEETKYGYNVRGLVSHVSSPDLRLTETGYEFEVPGATAGRSLPTSQRLSSSTASESTTTETEYDELGRPTVIRTGVGTSDVATTTRVYGPRGELREVVLPGGLRWTYGYDDLLRLTSITPPANSSRQVESFEWKDGLGRMTSHSSGSTWLYSYGSGETTETTPNGERRKTLVDGRGRAAAVQYFPVPGNAPGITGKTLRWDGWDALVGIDETRSAGPVETQAFTYDPSHRLTEVVRGLALTASRVRYTYNAPTRQPSLKNSLGYGYDALGRLSSVTAPWGVTGVTWEAGGQRLKTLGAETFDYDGRGWLKSVTTPQGVRRYDYDGRGNRLTETMTGSTVAVRQFSYDSADRLVATQEWDGHIEAWVLHGDGAKQQELQWPAGTPFSRPFDFATANPAVTKNYTYRTDGTLQSVTDAVSNFVEVGYTHDNNGQVTQRTVGGVSTTYGWDVDGRLVTANSSRPGLPTLAATYQYDGLGMRRRAQVAITPTNGPPVSTIRDWTWGGADGEDEVEEDGNVTTFVAGYRVGDGINVFSHDGIGSVVAQDDGANTNEAQFSTWGTRTALGTNFGPLASSAGFTGHRVEDALGLSYAKRRWLDSSTGAWLSRDDVGAASYLQSPNELNPWQYAAGNPTRFTDPDGRGVPVLPTVGPPPNFLFCLGLSETQCRREREGAALSAVQAAAGLDCVLTKCAVTGAALRLGGVGFTAAYFAGVKGHREDGTLIESIPDPVTATIDGVQNAALECRASPGVTMACGMTALAVAPPLLQGARSLMSTNAVRSTTVAVMLESAPLSVEADQLISIAQRPALPQPRIVDPILRWQAGALRDVAVRTHALAEHPRDLRSTTVALALVRLPNGTRTVFAAGSRNSLRPEQRRFLAAQGVPEANVVTGEDSLFKTYWTEQDEFGEWWSRYAAPPAKHPQAPLNHAEQTILRHLPEGAVVEEWGISWTTTQKPLPCEACSPVVRPAPLQYDVNFFFSE